MPKLGPSFSKVLKTGRTLRCRSPAPRTGKNPEALHDGLSRVRFQSFILLGHRQTDRGSEPGPVASIDQDDLPTMGLQDLPDDCKAEPCSTMGAIPRRLAAEERFENKTEIRFGNSGPIVFDDHAGHALPMLQPDIGTLTVADRIRQEIVDHATQGSFRNAYIDGT